MSVEGALDDLREGSAAAVARAVAALESAARDGEAEASRHLATLAAAGVGLPQSWARSLVHLYAAARGGSPSARGQLKVLAAGGPPTHADEDNPAYWRGLSARVHIEDWLKPCEKRVLNAAPRVVAIAGFLPFEVCDWIIRRADGRLTPALVYATDGVATQASGSRSNSALELGITDCDVVVLLVRQRIAATIGVPAGALETSQVLHYAAGEQYARHFDYLDPALPDVAERGQRIVTFLVYLNHAFEGGETEFPRLGLKHRGGTGDALYFGNLGSDGAPDTQTLHAGLPPTSGEKWLFSQWIRNQARV